MFIKGKINVNMQLIMKEPLKILDLQNKKQRIKGSNCILTIIFP